MANAGTGEAVGKPDESAQVGDGKPTEAKGEGKEGSAPKEKVRSEVSYPYYGLTKAIEIVEAVRRAGGNEASNEAVQKELGAKTTDRLWAYGIPAATQFGLLQRVGRGDEGRVKLTDLAMRIVYPGSPAEGRLARASACKNPELYGKLLEKFAGHPVPTKEGLRNILFREFKIVESMAPNAADAFIDSIKAAELVVGDRVVLGDATDPSEKSAPPTSPPAPNEAQAATTQTLIVPADYIIYKCKLSGGRVIDVPLPRKFSSADVDRLHNFLKTQIDDDEPKGGA